MADWRKIKRPRKKRRMSKKASLEQRVDFEFTHVIGVDEVGWGAIAGPIGVGLCVLPADFDEAEFKDSKKYSTDAKREEAAAEAKEHACYMSVNFVWPEAIMAKGAGRAMRLTMKEMILHALDLFPNAVVVIDGKNAVPGVPKDRQVVMPKADDLIPACSAASVIAKVMRDDLMVGYAKKYPGFEFEKNKGYPTEKHRDSLDKRGPCGIHRRNVALVKKAQKKADEREEEASSED